MPSHGVLGCAQVYKYGHASYRSDLLSWPEACAHGVDSSCEPHVQSDHPGEDWNKMIGQVTGQGNVIVSDNEVAEVQG